MSRKNTRLNDPAIIAKREAYIAATKVGPNMAVTPGAGGPLGAPLITSDDIGRVGGGGWAVGSPKQIDASGQHPAVNPFMIPKRSGLSVVSQSYPSNYFVEWDLSTWRRACDRVIKEGWAIDYATMTEWAYQASPFIQSMFRTVDTSINSVPYYFVDRKGNVMEDWTKELCGKPWHMDLRREIAFSFFWGFTTLNFDPVAGKIYKYPQSVIDPLNRMVRKSTFSLFDGVFCEDHDNLLFIQPNTSQEAFLGWMQAITRMFIQMNLNDTNWVQAGKKLAFPVFTIGYPEGSDKMGDDGLAYNPYRDEAEQIAQDIGPGKAVVFPFIRQPDGTIVKNIEVEFEQTGASQKAHSIYKDFNDDKKNEIREMILGGTLTADVGNSGSRALGEVQERKLKTFLKSVNEFVVAYLNDEYLRKISKYYTNFPFGGSFDINRAQQLTIDEIAVWSTVVQASGRRFTTEFFEQNGIPPNFLEDAPDPASTPAQGLSKKNNGEIKELHAEMAGFEKKKW